MSQILYFLYSDYAKFSPKKCHAPKKSADPNFSLNGFGIDYIHGFGLSKSLPMFLEVGGNLNFNFGGPTLAELGDLKAKIKMQDINFQVPINYVYRFNIGKKFQVSPYIGANFKLHLITRGKEAIDGLDEYEGSEWTNFFDKEKMDEAKWNRFQMGWHVGVGVQYSRLCIGLQYGTDFIPAYSYTEDDSKERINTGNFKLTLGYQF